MLKYLSACVGIAASLTLMEPSQEAVHGQDPLLAVAQRDPMTFVMSLANMGTPAGLEIRSADRSRIGRLEPLKRGTTTQASAHDAVSAFNSRRVDYRAELIDGVIVVRPSNSRARYLDEAAPTGLGSVTGVMNAALKIFAPLSSSLTAAGSAGSFLGGADRDRGASLVVDLRDGNARVIDALNKAAKQARFHAWLVETKGTEPVAIYRVGFIHPDGVTSEVTITD